MWQPVFMISGYVLGILGLIMLIPAGLEMVESGEDWSHFISSAMISMFFGFSLFLANYTKIEKINLKQAYLITTVCWLLMCLFAALPFVFYPGAGSTVNAIFEATSGLTGSGATIMHDVESLPQSILLWRSLLNYIGGLGVVIFAVALLPFLGIGGMQIFQRENSDSNDKFMPKFSYIAKRIILVYSLLGGIAAGTLFICGMSAFDAVNHALSALGTGGFSTKNASIAAFDSPLIELAVMIFMMCGALPLTFYILLFRRGTANKNDQVSVFFKLVICYSVFVSIFLYADSEYSLWTAVRYSFFSVISVVTTTGFAVSDFPSWGVWATGLFLLLSLQGGCTGSTSGSIKIFRWQIIYAFLHKYLLSAVEPRRVIPLKVGEVNVSEKVTMSVFVYVFAFLISLLLISGLVCLCGVEFRTAFAATVACITNVGMGAVDVIGPLGNYDFFSDVVKYILCFAMFLGRLEIITVLVIFTKSFWHR